MSGSGFYKFRCKNFLTYNCENWVWVNHSACAECVASGRDGVESEVLRDDDCSNSGSLPSPTQPRYEIISPRRKVTTMFASFGLLPSRLEEEEEEHTTTMAAALRSRETHGSDDAPGILEVSVKVHPCCKH